jgi:hypothetical protein
LKVPILRDRTGAGELSHRLVDFVPKFLSWLISFFIERMHAAASRYFVGTIARAPSDQYL